MDHSLAMCKGNGEHQLRGESSGHAQLEWFVVGCFGRFRETAPRGHRHGTRMDAVGAVDREAVEKGEDQTLAS
jgi:hypothetical protein